MRLQVRDLCVILGSVVVLLFFAIGEDTERHYCTSCGLLRLSEFRTWLGFTGPKSTRYRETEYHRLLRSTGQIECNHQWTAFYWSHHRAHSGERHIPFILQDGGSFEFLLKRLARLEDLDNLFAILQSIDLQDVIDENRRYTYPAFEKLENISGRVEEQEWWKENCHLFEGRLPRNKTMKRTTSP